MISLPDRYKARPKGVEFEEMCLGTFCSEFRVLATSQIPSDGEDSRTSVYKLQKNLGYIQRRTRTDAAVIRYPRFSPKKNPEKYFQSILQLFLPHRCDAHLKPRHFEKYEDFYNSGSVILNDKLYTVKSLVDTNMSHFDKAGRAVDQAEELLEKMGPQEDAWAQICPETEAERLECRNSGPKDNMEDETNENHCPDLGNAGEGNRIEIHNSPISRQDAQPMLRSLNTKQRRFLYKIRDWCLAKRNGHNPDPFHVFLSGGAGTGKSHLIKCVYYEARILRPLLSSPDDISFLLTAPTGVSAFNIGATTIHSTFSIPTPTPSTYHDLGQDKLNTLRCKLQSREILIIDEISMVDKKMLSYIHERLRQVKQTGDSYFGNVSIIAVGDFHQLPPVKATPLFSKSVGKMVGIDYWNGVFCLTELDQIMRQRDDLAFANTLNRLRTKKKSDKMQLDDRAMLRQQETGEESYDLHIFPLREQVDNHNLRVLHRLNTDAISIEAQNFTMDTGSGRLVQRKKPFIKVQQNGCLPRVLSLCNGARVMLIKNIDVSDGLVNEAFGTVEHIANASESSTVNSIYVKFDNNKVGQKRRSTESIPGSMHVSADAVPIIRIEEKTGNSGSIRQQFPLKLAWACTVYKVQGLTVEKATVSLSRVFAAGQAYVALSRVTALGGLTIQGFSEGAIFSNPKIPDSLAEMPQFLPTETITATRNETRFLLHNIQGLCAHGGDMNTDERILACDFLCLTETWLRNGSQTPPVHVNNFDFCQRPRCLSYDISSSNELHLDLQQQDKGGVAIYSKESTTWEEILPPVWNLEYLAFYIPSLATTVAVMYRPQSYTVNLYIPCLQKLLQQLNTYAPGSIIMGDFNQDVLGGPSRIRFMEENGYRQCVQQPTTEGGTLLDHVYVRRMENVIVSIIPTYYSYHEAILIRVVD